MKKSAIVAITATVTIAIVLTVTLVLTLGPDESEPVSEGPQLDKIVAKSRRRSLVRLIDLLTVYFASNGRRCRRLGHARSGDVYRHPLQSATGWGISVEKSTQARAI